MKQHIFILYQDTAWHLAGTEEYTGCNSLRDNIMKDGTKTLGRTSALKRVFLLLQNPFIWLANWKHKVTKRDVDRCQIQEVK